MNEDIINNLLDLIARLKEDISLMKYQADIYDETIQKLSFVNREMRPYLTTELIEEIERKWDEKKKRDKEVPF